ncbi:jg4179 [Pararge aegeria aegeria]|uniref:Jg4179 protein n=1 Tax=Pararge aegeria aegeria TaxID=348720 RepID=A0A8S4S7B6_9NEOP|nr:jg4179 [Pararge aegeria aegeria]
MLIPHTYDTGYRYTTIIICINLLQALGYGISTLQKELARPSKGLCKKKKNVSSDLNNKPQHFHHSCIPYVASVSIPAAQTQRYVRTSQMLGFAVVPFTNTSTGKPTWDEETEITAENSTDGSLRLMKHYATVASQLKEKTRDVCGHAVNIDKDS